MIRNSESTDCKSSEETGQPFDLCIGDGEIFWEFADEETRERVWADLIASYGWNLYWARPLGKRCISILQDEIPIAYRWKCSFLK